MQERKISTTLVSSRQEMPPRRSCSPTNSIDNWMLQEESKITSTRVLRLTIKKNPRQWIESKDAMLKSMKNRRHFKPILMTLVHSRKRQKQSMKVWLKKEKWRRFANKLTSSLRLNNPKRWLSAWKLSLDYSETAAKQTMSTLNSSSRTPKSCQTN